MPPLVLINSRIYAGANDLTGDTNALALEFGADMLDGTTFGHDTRINKAGNKSVVASAEGFLNANGSTSPNAVIFASVGEVENIPVTIAPETGADGEIAFIFRAVYGEYGPSGDSGELMGFSATFEGADGAPHIQATILRPALFADGAYTNPATASGAGVGRNIGAAGADDRIFATLHVFDAAGVGATLDVVVESDSAADFASPTTRLTFGQKSAAGSDWQVADGPVTDTWWRVTFTLGGASPSFNFAVALGIA